MNIEELSIDEILSAFNEGKFTSKELVQKSIDVYEADKSSPTPLNAFLEMYDDALDRAEKADELRLEALKADGGKAGKAIEKLIRTFDLEEELPF